MRTNSSVAEGTSKYASGSRLPEQELYFPAGLLGFPTCHRYKLARFNPGSDDESPFFMLHSLDQDISFPLIHPDSIALPYRFPIDAELLRTLAASAQNELVTFVIVTVRERVEDITLNLQGPVLINPTSSLGMQLVVEDFPLRYPLFKATSS